MLETLQILIDALPFVAAVTAIFLFLHIRHRRKSAARAQARSSRSEQDASEAQN